MARRIAPQEAFTLVEVLVAIAVVTLLVLVVLAMLTGATQATGQSQQHLSADSEARQVFDRMDEDFLGMVKRPDVDYIFAKASSADNHNDTLFFFSEAPALAEANSTSPGNTCALVGFRINPKYQLERLGKGLALGLGPPGGMMFLTYSQAPSPGLSLTPDPNSTFANPLWSPLLGSPSTSPPYQGDSSSTDDSSVYFHVLSEGVFRLEYCFLLKPAVQADGTVLPAVYSNYPYDTRLGHGPTLYGIGPSDIQAIIVSLAVLDVKSRLIVSASDLTQLANSLPDPQDSDLAASPPKLPAQLWNNALAITPFSGALKTAVKDVHFYQRAFNLESALP